MASRSYINSVVGSDAVKSQFLAHVVPQRNRKHAVEMINELVTPFAVGIEHHFGIRLGSERMTPALKLAAQPFKAVNFAVKYDPIASIRRKHRLICLISEVDVRETSKTYFDYAIETQATRIRSSVGQCRKRSGVVPARVRTTYEATHMPTVSSPAG